MPDYYWALIDTDEDEPYIIERGKDGTVYKFTNTFKEKFWVNPQCDLYQFTMTEETY